MSDGDQPFYVKYVRAVTPPTVRRSFTMKYALVILIMAASVGVVGVLATDRMAGQVNQSVMNQYEGVAQQDADIVERWLDRNRLSARLVSGQDRWRDDEGLRSSLRTERARLPDSVAEIHLIRTESAGGTVVASTSLESGTDVSDRSQGWVFDTTFANGTVVRRSSSYRSGSTPVVGFASPIPGRSPRILLIEYSLGGIADDLHGAEQSQTGFTQVVSRNGTVQIAEPVNTSSAVGDDVLTLYGNASGESMRPIDAAFDGHGDGHHGSGVIPSLPAEPSVIDESYAVGYARVEGTNWVVLVHAPRSELLAGVGQTQIAGLLATLTGVVLIAGVGALQGYSTAGSINRLTRKTEEIRQGNLAVEIHSDRIDEIGRLYDSFAAMRNTLESQIEEAEQARQDAEVSRAEAVAMTEYLEEKAEEFGGVMEAAANGDMTQRMETDGKNDSMDRIAEAFNEMIGELEQTVAQLGEFAEEVADESDAVSDDAASLEASTAALADSVAELSDDAADQQAALDSIVDSLADVRADLQALEDDGVDVSSSVERIEAVQDDVDATAETSDVVASELSGLATEARAQSDELANVDDRVSKLRRFAGSLGAILARFTTDADHEFVFTGGPSQSSLDDENDGDD